MRAFHSVAEGPYEELLGLETHSNTVPPTLSSGKMIL